MYALRKRGHRKRYVYGGSGIFESFASFMSRLFASNAAKQITSTALDVGKSAAKEVGKKALNVGKTAVLDAGKKLIEKGVTRVLTPKSQAILHNYASIPTQQSSPDAVAKKAHNILSKYVDTGAQNINSLIDGSGMQKAIAIQDLVRKLNTRGSGLKTV